MAVKKRCGTTPISVLKFQSCDSLCTIVFFHTMLLKFLFFQSRWIISALYTFSFLTSWEKIFFQLTWFLALCFCQDKLSLSLKLSNYWVFVQLNVLAVSFSRCSNHKSRSNLNNYSNSTNFELASTAFEAGTNWTQASGLSTVQPAKTASGLA